MTQEDTPIITQTDKNIEGKGKKFRNNRHTEKADRFSSR